MVPSRQGHFPLEIGGTVRGLDFDGGVGYLREVQRNPLGPSKSEKSNETDFWAFAKDRKPLTIDEQSGGHLSFSCFEKPPCPPLRVAWWHRPAPPPCSCEGGWDLSHNFISSTVFGPGMDCAGKKKQPSSSVALDIRMPG